MCELQANINQIFDVEIPLREVGGHVVEFKQDTGTDESDNNADVKR